MNSFSPPYTTLSRSAIYLQEKGFALLHSDEFFVLSEHSAQDWQQLSLFWNSLSADEYLKDGGKYRKRKHASVIVTDQSIDIVPYRPHFQPLSYNALHGGMNRVFTACDEQFLKHPAMFDLLIQLGDLFTQVLAKEKQNLRFQNFRNPDCFRTSRPRTETPVPSGVSDHRVSCPSRSPWPGPPRW